MLESGVHSPEDRRFVGLASGVLDDILVRDPVHATQIGDHRFDGRLPDHTQDGADEFARVLQRHQQFLDRIEDRALSRFAAADLQILRDGVAQRIFDLTVLRRHEWDPLLWNPADSLYSLCARPFAPATVRARSLRQRLAAVPEFLDNARHTLTQMPAIHVTTAISQLGQISPMLTQTAEDLLAERGVAEAMEGAMVAVARHQAWLEQQLPASAVVPAAIGPERYVGVMTHHLGMGPQPDPDALLAAAEDDLERVLDITASEAAKFGRSTMAAGTVIPDTLGRLAAASDVTQDSLIDVAAEALEAAAVFLAERRLVTVPPMDVRLELMPPVRRGVAVAYCDAPGALESPDLPTLIGIAPAPDEWDEDRRRSYYGEYNRNLLYDLMVHEAVPGHALQLAHARNAQAPTHVRAAMPSSLFIEGWAVYAEELMAHRGFEVQGQRRGSLRLHQLKMQLRLIINTILDIRVHTRGMTEAEARRLMATKGFQQEGEIVGKWDRARLTSGQLPTYYVGYKAVAAIVADLDDSKRDWDLQQVHDAVLSHGSVPPHILRSLVGLE